MAARTLEDLAESFSIFDSWEDRYRYLIDLGQRLDPMDEALKTGDNLVPGCTSRVWLVAGTEGRRFHFIADSDAQIVRGLIYILVVAFQDKPLDDIKQIDIQKSFERLGLHQHLSPNRRNGFFSIVDKIKSLAAAA